MSVELMIAASLSKSIPKLVHYYSADGFFPQMRPRSFIIFMANFTKLGSVNICNSTNNESKTWHTFTCTDEVITWLGETFVEDVDFIVSRKLSGVSVLTGDAVYEMLILRWI
jgi:hypothetical protein